MAFTYRIYDQYAVYFVTFTVTQWVDVFTRQAYKDILVESLKFCQRIKGLQVYSWVIMNNHMHLIIGSQKEKLSNIIRDYKKYTSGQIIRAISENPKESRKSWLLWLLKNEKQKILWQPGYHGEEVSSTQFYRSKERYIHLNPVRAGIVFKKEDYIYSSYCTRAGVRKGLIELADY